MLSRTAFSFKSSINSLAKFFSVSVQQPPLARDIPNPEKKMPSSTFVADGISATKSSHSMYVSMLEHNIKQALMAYPFHSEPVANSYMELGVAVQQEGYTDRALKYYETALKIFEKLANNKPTLQIAGACVCIGSVHFDRRDLPNALSYQLRARAIRSELLPPRHPLLAESANNVATLFSLQHKHFEAAEMFAEALGIVRETAKEKDGPLVALTLYNLGCALRSGGWWERAKFCLEEALDMAQRFLGHDDGLTLRIEETLKKGPGKEKLMTAGELIEAKKQETILLKEREARKLRLIEEEEKLKQLAASSGRSVDEIVEEENEKEEGFVEIAPGLKTRVLQDGLSSKQVPVGARVFTHYCGWLDGFNVGRKFDSSRDRNQPFSFIAGGGEVIQGWDLIVKQMKVGERRQIIISPELGYGHRGAGRVIPPNSTLYFDLEVLGFE